MLTKSKELPGGPLSPRAPSSYPSCHAWSLASFTLYGSFNRKCCRLRSDLDQCSGWELSKPHRQGTRQRPPEPALKCYLRGSRWSSSRPSECLTGGWCQNASGPLGPGDCHSPPLPTGQRKSRVHLRQCILSGQGGSRH